MDHASLALPFAPVFPTVSPAARRTVLLVARATWAAVSCVLAAALMWLVLAGPGVMSDHASTVAGRHAVR